MKYKPRIDPYAMNPETILKKSSRKRKPAAATRPLTKRTATLPHFLVELKWYLASRIPFPAESNPWGIHLRVSSAAILLFDRTGMRIGLHGQKLTAAQPAVMGIVILDESTWIEALPAMREVAEKHGIEIEIDRAGPETGGSPAGPRSTCFCRKAPDALTAMAEALLRTLGGLTDDSIVEYMAFGAHQ